MASNNDYNVNASCQNSHGGVCFTYCAKLFAQTRVFVLIHYVCLAIVDDHTLVICTCRCELIACIGLVFVCFKSSQLKLYLSLFLIVVIFFIAFTVCSKNISNLSTMQEAVMIMDRLQHSKSAKDKNPGSFSPPISCL